MDSDTILFFIILFFIIIINFSYSALSQEILKKNRFIQTNLPALF